MSNDLIKVCVDPMCVAVYHNIPNITKKEYHPDLLYGIKGDLPVAILNLLCSKCSKYRQRIDI